MAFASSVSLRRLVSLSALLLVCPTLGCGDDGSPADSGPLPDGSVPDAAGDAGPMACDAPFTSCPDDPPLAGAACEGDLTCMYIHPLGGTEWNFYCEGGMFREESLCAGCPPIFAEFCRDPFMGTMTGTTVEIGPADGEFRPFMDGERIMPVFGAQGGSMVEWRLNIGGATPPACVSYSATVSLDAMTADPDTNNLKLRCGESARVFTVFPDNPCEFRDYDVTLTVDVTGIGSTTVNLVLEGGSCPRGGGL